MDVVSLCLVPMSFDAVYAGLCGVLLGYVGPGAWGPHRGRTPADLTCIPSADLTCMFVCALLVVDSECFAMWCLKARKWTHRGAPGDPSGRE